MFCLFSLLPFPFPPATIGIVSVPPRPSRRRLSDLQLPNLQRQYWHLQNPLSAPLSQVRQRLATGRLVLHSLLAGVLVGLLGCLLRLCLDYAVQWGSLLTGYSPPAVSGEGGLLMAFGQVLPYGLLALPFIAVVSAWLTRQSASDPLSEAVSEYHRRPSLGVGAQLQQLAGNVLGYAAGLPVGRDAVYTALGGLNVTLLGKLVVLSRSEERSLTLASTAAALGLVLHAPLAAAVLLTEVLYRRFEFEFEVLLPALLASVSAYAVYELAYGASALFTLPTLQVPGAAQLPLYALLGLVVAVVAWLNTWAAKAVPDRLTQGYGRYLWAALLGTLIAAIAYWFTPAVLGGGAGWMQLGLGGFLGQEALGYAAWKWLLLALSVRLGFGGGVLPSAATGALLGLGLNALLPSPIDASVCALVSATAYLSVTLNIPVAATLLAVAWGGDGLLPTALIASGLGHAISGHLSFVTGQKRDRLSADIELITPTTTILNAPPLPSQDLLYRVAAPALWVGLSALSLPLPTGVQLLGLERGEDIALPEQAGRVQSGDILDMLANEAAFEVLREQLQLQ